LSRQARSMASDRRALPDVLLRMAKIQTLLAQPYKRRERRGL
jgi:hypothetical protein